jgi:hypothetical protein
MERLVDGVPVRLGQQHGIAALPRDAHWPIAGTVEQAVELPAGFGGSEGNHDFSVRNAVNQS